MASLLDRLVRRLGPVWAGVIGLIGVATIGEVNPDSRLLVGAASVLTAGAALGAARYVETRPRRAGWLLIASAAAPTFGLWALNVVPLVVGVMLAFRPSPERSVSATRR